MAATAELNDPGRGPRLVRLIKSKTALRRLYDDTYLRLAEAVKRSPPGGQVLELGSGCGFLREFIPEVITSDVIPYDNVDRVIDALKLPFENATLRAVVMLNVFHHIPDVEVFLGEAQRCLVPGGRLIVVDQHPGLLSTPILRYGHHEPFDAEAADWAFPSNGPLAGANGALAWIVFVRDRARFERRFPALRLERYRPHTPLVYWLAGGLKRWSLLPGFAYPAARFLDRVLVAASPSLGSFVDVEIRKVEA